MNRGIIQLLIIIILFIIILSLLGVSLSSLFNEHTLRENFNFVWSGVMHVWQTYVAEYAQQAWQAIRGVLRKTP